MAKDNQVFIRKPFMKKYLFLFLSFFLYKSTHAQITFNHRLHFDRPNAILTSVLSTDSCYYASGVVTQPNNFDGGNIFVKFDLNGEILFQKVVESSYKAYECWNGSTLINENNNLSLIHISEPTRPY